MAYRQADKIQEYLENLFSNELEEVEDADVVEELIEEHGHVVVGLFDEANSTEYPAFKETAFMQMSKAKFVSCQDAVVASTIAEYFEVLAMEIAG